MNNFYESLGYNLKKSSRNIFFQVPNNYLIQETVKKNYGTLTNQGALIVKTGKHTGRSAKDKYVVESSETKKTIWWENSINKMTSEKFEKLKQYIIEKHNEDKQDLYITERSIGAEEKHNIGIRLVTTHPQHALFSNHLFRRTYSELGTKDFTILHAPELLINPEDFDVHSPTVITTCFETNTTLIVGTLYAGEIKKSMFSVMNYLLPTKKILPMHTGANQLKNKESSLFFGLSGTGKQLSLQTKEHFLLVMMNMV